MAGGGKKKVLPPKAREPSESSEDAMIASFAPGAAVVTDSPKSRDEVTKPKEYLPGWVLYEVMRAVVACFEELVPKARSHTVRDIRLLYPHAIAQPARGQPFGGFDAIVEGVSVVVAPYSSRNRIGCYW
eukprot:PhM_4_TR13310/c0_g1_i4/m.21029